MYHLYVFIIVCHPQFMNLNYSHIMIYVYCYMYCYYITLLGGGDKAR